APPAPRRVPRGLGERPVSPAARSAPSPAEARSAMARAARPTVSGVTRGGEGGVRAGKTVFVAGALPGERIRFRRTRRHRQHDDGELLELLSASPERVAPRCAHFGVCGGCALQHLSGAAQLAAKETELKETLARVGRVEPASWLEPLAGPEWGYRRRARLGVKFVHKKGCVVVGFRERAAPYVAQLSRCEVLTAPVGELIAPLAVMLGELTIREQLPQIEVAVADNATALVLRVLATPSAADLARLREFAAAHRLRLYLQPGGLDSVRELEPPGEPLSSSAPAPPPRATASPTPSSTAPISALRPIRRSPGCASPTPTCCSTRRAPGRARCSRRWRRWRRGACCMSPAIRGALRGISRCWCTSTASSSRRPAWSTCF